MVGLGALVMAGIATQRRRPSTGIGTMIGQIVEVRQRIDPEGMVFVEGALWRAWSDEGPFDPGEMVEIRSVAALRAYVIALERDGRTAQ
ncbi:MAG: hypothetical protein NVS2B7_05800 [Herpetosiphon sp.]